ncbi:hypothetical protein [Actinomycetospora flava]|uniref:Uncharacterized protein n=1 Tax=Actinomycetospora flava TaxID=3129232 RepID=A0ABU8M585_9PSEU
MALSPPPSRLPRDHFVDTPTVSLEIPRARQGGRWVDPPASPTPPPAPPRSTLALALAALVLVCLVVAGLVLVLVVSGL